MKLSCSGKRRRGSIGYASFYDRRLMCVGDFEVVVLALSHWDKH